jgi:FMN phosphatase YigB (HAD superfamily)
MIILDFDGVLFNDLRFKRDYERLFRRAGVPRRAYRDTYARARDLPGGVYRHDLHLALIRAHISAARLAALERGIMDFGRRTAGYLYRDAVPTLRYWQSAGEPLALVSCGHDFQRTKVMSSGIASFFADIVIADTQDKATPVGDLLRRHMPPRAVFIDDRAYLSDSVKKHSPRVTVLQMIRRKGGERSRHADGVVSSLAAAQRWTEKNLLR